MEPILVAIILSMLPISELRAGIPYAILNGVGTLNAFFFCVFANIIIIPIIFLFLDNLNDIFMKIKIWNRFFTNYLNRKVSKVQRKYKILSFFVLFLFVAVPFPATGAYTGVLLAWFFKLDRKKSFSVISLGVITAGIIVTLASVLGVSLFGLIF